MTIFYYPPLKSVEYLQPIRSKCLWIKYTVKVPLTYMPASSLNREMHDICMMKHCVKGGAALRMHDHLNPVRGDREKNNVIAVHEKFRQIIDQEV